MPFVAAPHFKFAGPGVLVSSVVPDSPAERGGLLAKDVLIRIDDTGIADLRAFSGLLGTLVPDQEVTAVVLRNGEEVSLTVQVVARRRAAWSRVGE